MTYSETHCMQSCRPHAVYGPCICIHAYFAMHGLSQGFVGRLCDWTCNMQQLYIFVTLSHLVTIAVTYAWLYTIYESNKKYIYYRSNRDSNIQAFTNTHKRVQTSIAYSYMYIYMHEQWNQSMRSHHTRDWRAWKLTGWEGATAEVKTGSTGRVDTGWHGGNPNPQWLLGGSTIWLAGPKPSRNGRNIRYNECAATADIFYVRRCLHAPL